MDYSEYGTMVCRCIMSGVILPLIGKCIVLVASTFRGIWILITLYDEKRFKRKTEALYETLRREKGRLFLGDLFKEWGPGRKAILTDCHYTPSFNKFLAGHLASHIDLRKLSVSAGYLPQEATGAPRPQDLGKDFN